MDPSSDRVPLLVDWYEGYLADQDSAAFVRRIGGRYTPATLERLVLSNERKVRRAAVLALGMIGDFSSNAVLGSALTDVDRLTRCLAEQGIRALWLRDGSEAQRQELLIVVRLNSSQQYKDALRRAGELIHANRQLAEAWNQRAIAYYCLGRYEESIADCNQAMELNPYHFGAAGGMGQCYVHQGDFVAALTAFRHALSIYPHLEGVRASVNYIERAMERE